MPNSLSRITDLRSLYLLVILAFTVIIDIYMMLIGGFGFLMTFLKRHGFSSLGYTLVIVTLVTEWTIIMRGFLHMDESYTIHLTFLE